MTDKFVCYTLFNITKTGVLNRNTPADTDEIKKWVEKRNTQCNFDTILQAISLRSQPEQISNPEKVKIDLNTEHYFGFLYKQKYETIACWRFFFEVQHSSVFDDESPLGALYRDVDEIPMIECAEQISGLPLFLDTTPELKNIHFMRFKDEN